jgi:hypothetical protein
MTRCVTGLSRKRFFVIALGLCLDGLTACHSAFVETTINNQGPSDMHLVEVDYPSASFGVETIAARSQFNYRFKIQGSGSLKLEFTDAAGKVHDLSGPILNQGQEGHLTIVIHPAGEVSWEPALRPAK